MSTLDTLQFRVGALVPKELLDLLNDIYPNRCPDLGTPMDKVWFDSGASSVVAFLNQCHELATKAALEN